MLKTMLKIIRRQLLPEKNAIRKYLNFPRRFFKFQCDYDLNLCRYLNPELPRLRDFGSLNFLNRHTFVLVCGTLFRGRKLKYPRIAWFPETKLHILWTDILIQKWNTCRYVEIQSRIIKFPQWYSSVDPCVDSRMCVYTSCTQVPGVPDDTRTGRVLITWHDTTWCMCTAVRYVPRFRYAPGIRKVVNMAAWY
jgi:hypothetical protein